MTKTIAAVLLLATLFINAAQATPTVTAISAVTQDILNAGELRLQSQRLAKLWLQAGLGIHTDHARRQLASTTARCGQNLAALAHHAQREPTRRHLQRSAQLWQELQVALRLPYTPENLATVNRIADELMLASGRLAQRIEMEGEGSSGRLLDLSLRQNMLAQRLARLTLMAQAGDRSRSRLVDIDQARKEFATSLQELIAAPSNPPDVRDSLELARTQWMFFERAISDIGRQESRPEHVATTSERIGEVLEGVGRHYAVVAVTFNSRLAATGSPLRN